MSTAAQVRNGRQASASDASSAGVAGMLEPVVMADVGRQPRLAERQDVGRAGRAQQDQPGIHRADPGQLAAARPSHRPAAIASSRAGSSCPSSAARAIAWRRSMRCGSRLGNASTRSSSAGVGNASSVTARQREHASVGGGKPLANRGGLGSMPPLAEDRPRGGLVRRVEQHGAEPGERRLQPADHRVSDARPRPTPTPDWSSDSTRRTWATT